MAKATERTCAEPRGFEKRMGRRPPKKYGKFDKKVKVGYKVGRGSVLFFCLMMFPCMFLNQFSSFIYASFFLGLRAKWESLHLKSLQRPHVKEAGGFAVASAGGAQL